MHIKRCAVEIGPLYRDRRATMLIAFVWVTELFALISQASQVFVLTVFWFFLSMLISEREEHV